MKINTLLAVATMVYFVLMDVNHATSLLLALLIFLWLISALLSGFSYSGGFLSQVSLTLTFMVFDALVAFVVGVAFVGLGLHP